MKFLQVFFFILLYGMLQGVEAQQPLFENTRYIISVQKDTLYVVSGSTYVFTVDTPEDSGLVNTAPAVSQLLADIQSLHGTATKYAVQSSNGTDKVNGVITNGDRFIVYTPGKAPQTYFISLLRKAIGGHLRMAQRSITVNTTTDLAFSYKAGQRSPDATITIHLPEGIKATMENTTVNIIGRGAISLKNLEKQSIGRTGHLYSYSKTGSASISNDGRVITFKHLDLRPDNGPDLEIVLHNVRCTKTGNYTFKAAYTTAAPEVLSSAESSATMKVTQTVSDLKRIPDTASSPELYTTTQLQWSSNIQDITVQQSLDSGKTWRIVPAVINQVKGRATVPNLQPGRYYLLRLKINTGEHKGVSNSTAFYSGKIDITQFGVTGDSAIDNTGKINEAIRQVHEMGGGTLLFNKGTYNVRTVHLKSHVWLYINKAATLKALKGGDAPETTWFSDKKYRSGLSPTDMGPYENPENWLTKQDVGHTFFNNAMFHGERIDNIKIVGNGYITGNGNLVTSDKVMNNAPDNRSDKMFSLKLCTNVEIGGIRRSEDLWYDSTRDEPYYILNNKTKDFNTSNMLRIDRAGHFVLLATGTDHIYVHDTYFAKDHTTNARDIYDFMSCNNVTVTNIYSKVSSDDIVKPGSDCSLGFTRPAKNYKVRNIIGDTNCNLFQIGSETADDITDICVDNIYVLGANKAGFSISTNDGGHIKNIHLNCGHTGSLHHRSKMYRTYTPFFISISNRGRVLGARAQRFRFKENGATRDELLVTNINIGRVENIILNGVDIAEVYAGSSFGKNKRWTSFDGTQRTATPIVAGYQLPDTKNVEGGLKFQLPNGIHTGYINGISFSDINIQVKGGHPAADTAARPQELGVGQYNASNLKLQPSWGFWARHVKNLSITNSGFDFEKADGRYAIYLEDVNKAHLQNLKTRENGLPVVTYKSSAEIIVK